MAYVVTFPILIDKRTKQYYLLSTNRYVLIVTTLYWILEIFAFRIRFMCTFSNVYTVPFHWFILLFLHCQYLRGQKWRMCFSYRGVAAGGLKNNRISTWPSPNILWNNSSIQMWSTSKDWKTGCVIKTGPTEKFL